MGIRNENFDKVLNVLIASTRSPREHFSAANSWKLLEKRLFTRRSKRILQFRITSAAAIALLCIASWLIYNAIRPVPMQTISTLAETRTVILPDQTEVTLNHYSTLTYPAHFKGDCSCGLSNYNYISPDLLVAFLRHAYSRTDVFRKLYKALPVGGIDGTLKNRMQRGTRSYKNVHAKTGSFTAINCLAGYLRADNGHEIAFAIMNQNALSGREARAFQDAVCEAVISSLY